MSEAKVASNREAPQRTMLPTWDLLKSLGFVEDATLISDDPGGLSLDFGNFRLSAIFGLNRWFRSVVLFTGIMSTPRTLTEVCFEMPREVDSWEQGLAWLTWSLDNAEGGVFSPRLPAPWLAAGREHRNLLPWNRQRAAYAARPHCQVRRDWARLALRTLEEHLAIVDEDTSVTLQFDGEILTIRVAGSVIAMPAEGDAWDLRYAIGASKLRWLPKRLMSEVVDVSIFDMALTIGNRRFSGLAPIERENRA